MAMHNFNSGPSILPKEVMEEAARAIIDFNGSGLSILEIGHRTSLFGQVLDEAIALVKELMQLDDAHEVLFLHGGATTQFMQVPMNLLNENEVAAYIDTGVWASKAIKEARLYGHVEILASSKEADYTYIPKNWHLPPTAKYLHITTNNTIYGTQWQQIPELDLPLVADMSSDILSRQMDFNRFALIYAGAQKNIGAAGVNLVVVNKEILGKVERPLPVIMDYRQHITNNSLLNTPPVFAIYVSLLTLRWLKKMGGAAGIEALNERKATLLYDTLDALPHFQPTVVKEDRSRMNVCWRMADPALEAEFLKICTDAGMVGVKGYRTVGGFRASLYNALPISSVELLVELMNDFAKAKG